MATSGTRRSGCTTLVLPRVDGVSLRGSVDPKGWCQQNRPDWIVDETAQGDVYDCLKAALDALCQ